MAVERITQSALASLYAELDAELARRNGYETINNLAPELEQTEGTFYGDAINTAPGSAKARVQHFNRAMKARQYIQISGDSTFFANEEE